jgi:hypothetical protein
MSETDVEPDQAEMGPVDFLVIEFPGTGTDSGTAGISGEGLVLLADLVDRRIIRLLDLAFVTSDQDGTVRALELQDLDGDGAFDLAVFAGASSGVLDEEDLRSAGSVIEPGTSAAVLVYENLWAAPLAAALRRGGAQMVASGRIPVDDLVAAVDAAEATADH